MSNFELNNDSISKLMTTVGIESMDYIIKKVKMCANCFYKQDNLPTGRDIHRLTDSYLLWRNKAIDYYCTFSNKHAKQLLEAINNFKISVITDFAKVFNKMLDEQGASFVSKIITANYEDYGTNGILNRIDDIIKTMNTEYDERIKKGYTTDRLIDELDKKATDIPSVLGVVKEEDKYNYFNTANNTIEKYTIDMEILAIMPEKLFEVKKFLYEYDLQRYIDAHNISFDNALKEIRNGKKTSHWMWYIFPQIKGLGKSSIADYYAIKNLDEAKAYLNNEYLKENTMKIVKALLELDISDPTQIFDSPDDLKLRSSMTLFHYVEPTETLFTEVLNRFYGGNFDRRTIAILKEDNGNTL